VTYKIDFYLDEMDEPDLIWLGFSGYLELEFPEKKKIRFPE